MTRDDDFSAEVVVARMRAIADLLDAPRIKAKRDVIDLTNESISATHMDVAEALNWPIMVNINGHTVIRNVSADRCWEIEDGLNAAGIRVKDLLPFAAEIEVEYA